MNVISVSTSQSCHEDYVRKRHIKILERYCNTVSNVYMLDVVNTARGISMNKNYRSWQWGVGGGE